MIEAQIPDYMEQRLAGTKKSSYWKWIVGATAVLLAVYAVASTYLWARQAHYIFRPERIIASTPTEYQLPFEDVYVKVNDGNGMMSESTPGGYLLSFPAFAIFFTCMAAP